MNSEQLIRDRLAGKGKPKKAQYLGPIIYDGEPIAQYHNPDIFIEDILGENDTKQFTSIIVSGSPGTGKSTLMTFIAHECHTRNPNYFVLHLGKKELLKFDSIMRTLPKGRDIILVFDDVSNVFKHIHDPDTRTKILTTLTEARHPEFEGTDRKIMVLAGVHYIYSMEKMWRSQGSWKFHTDLSNEEIQNFNHSTKSKFKHQVDLFATITLQQFRKKNFTVSLTNKQKRTYNINKPFRFVMVYDNSKIRFFLVPDHSCNLCSKDKNKHSKIKATPRDVIRLAKKYYKLDGIAGLKLALTLQGITHQYRNNLVYAFNTALEILSTFDVDPEALASEMRKDAQISDKRLNAISKKRLDFVKDLEDIQKNEGNVTFGSEAMKHKKKEDELLDEFADAIEEDEKEDLL